MGCPAHPREDQAWTQTRIMNDEHPTPIQDPIHDLDSTVPCFMDKTSFESLFSVYLAPAQLWLWLRLWLSVPGNDYLPSLAPVLALALAHCGFNHFLHIPKGSFVFLESNLGFLEISLAS